MEQWSIVFYLLLLLVAFLYSSVGHGGASGYLALMSLYSFAPGAMRANALCLNILVSLLAFIQYYRAGHFKWNLFWPFAIASVPAAFAGGFMTIEDSIYKKVLAVLLLFSVLKLSGIGFGIKQKKVNYTLTGALTIGAVIGLISGMIGIGGGILLSPLIILLNWADMKQTAALSALFIFVNSIAGIPGPVMNGFVVDANIAVMLLLAFSGGLLGSYFGAGKFNNAWLKRLLALGLLVASLKLLFT